MSKDYTEDKLIEQTSIQLFTEQLGWEYVFAYDSENFGSTGTLGRTAKSETVLIRYLKNALEKYNPNLPAQAYQNAIEKIVSQSSFQSIAEINREKYNEFRDGVSVDYKNEKGELITNKKLKVFDFDNYENNHFLLVSQLWVTGKANREKRPDLICFVNGIPLIFIELKSVKISVQNAYNDNFTDYKDTIPKLFHYNAFVILSNGIDSKIGGITSKFEHFNDWKRIKEEEEGIVSLETILKGTCEKNRLMDLFENFILFDDSMGKMVKLVARNHQFIGVNKAIASVNNMKELEGRLGVFWHTQGSGKSYSMVFFAQKAHRKLNKAYTFVIATDRKELDKQIYGTFAGVGAVNNPNVRAKDGEHLKTLLQEDHRYIFTIVHKFYSPKGTQYPELTSRDNIIVISDEAHRTQGGSLALNMRNAVPNASFIGFTGTPLFKDDELTKRIFGDYVSTYDFKRSIEDGATVPLYYENRGDNLDLKNPDINNQIRQAIDDADVDEDQQSKLEYLFAREYPILTAEKRLNSIAKDIVEHFNSRGKINDKIGGGKAMLVCLDKITCVRMYDLITKHWAEYVINFEKQMKKATDEMQMLEMNRELEWIKETEVCVVVSNEQNEVKKFRDWQLDIEPHREKMNSRDLETDFKDEDHPFRLAIVCAMWITGFDVPSLSTLYLDKPLKAHTLMQTIARANRVHEGKNNGLIVDYIESYKALTDALAIYGKGDYTGGTSGGGETPEPPIRPIEVLEAELKEVIEETKNYLFELGYTLQELIDANGFQKIAEIAKAVDLVYKSDDTKKKYEIMAREVFKKYKAILHKKDIANRYMQTKEAIDVIYSRIQDNVENADIAEIMLKIQSIVDASVNNIVAEPNPNSIQKFIDLSGLDFDKLKANFLQSDKKNTTVQLLKDKIEQRLQDMVAKNPTRVDFYKKYQEIIDEYNRGKDTVTIEQTFNSLVDFVNALTDEQKRTIEENLTEEELAIFDLLKKPELNKKDKEAVKKVSIELLTKLKQEKLNIEKWAEKTQISAAIQKEIYDYLYGNLPETTYAIPEIDVKTNLVYEHIRNTYQRGIRI